MVSKITAGQIETIQCFAGNPYTTSRVSKAWSEAAAPALLQKALQDPYLSNFRPEMPSSTNDSFRWDPQTKEHLDSGARYAAYQECRNNPRLCLKELYHNKQKAAELRKQSLPEMVLSNRNLAGIITVFVGDPHVTERIAKIWKGHKTAIFTAILASWRRNPILLGFYPKPGQTSFVYDYTRYQLRTPLGASEAYINHCSDPELCVETMLGDLRGQLRQQQTSLSNDRVLSQTEVGTLDRARLTSFFKVKAAQQFIEQIASSLMKWNHPNGTDALIKEGCLKPSADLAAMESGLKKRAVVMNAFIQTAAAKGLSAFEFESLHPYCYFLPAQFGSLTDLTTLKLQDQGLSTLPLSIGKCFKLQILDLSGCPFVVFPKEIGQCKELEEVNLAMTSILRLDELDQCPKLKKIVLDDYSLEKRLTLTPRTVALLEKLKISIPAREEDPLAQQVYELQLPPENMDEIDLEEVARMPAKTVEKQESKVEQSGQPKDKSFLKTALDAFWG